MALFLENFYLQPFKEDDTMFQWLVIQAAKTGRPIQGYDGKYYNADFKNLQLILRVEKNPNDGPSEIAGIDTHAPGMAVWTVQAGEMNIQRKDADKLEKRVVVSRPDDSGGMAVVNIVNADVRPSYMPGDILNLQMAMFPLSIHYYEDEEAYVDAEKISVGGERCTLADGFVMPIGLFQNRNPESADFESDEYSDDIVLVRATVQEVYVRDVELTEELRCSFLACIVKTEFGELDIIHTLDQVDESERDNIKKGATVYCSGLLSGDAAIYEYENGLILDEHHDLMALREVFIGGDPERIRSILAEDAAYYSQASGETYAGAEAVLERLHYVQAHHSSRYFAFMGEIESVDAPRDPSLPYGSGKECVLLASEREDNFESMVFIETDGDGKIRKMSIVCDSRFHFRVKTA